MKVLILTISDKASVGQREDTAGPAVGELLVSSNYEVQEITIIPDEFDIIVEHLHKGVQNKIPLLLTVGGTGFSKRDNTPEATLKVIKKQTPGLNEYMRSKSLEITDRAMLSRAISGIADETLIINLPGSKKAAVENLSWILPTLEHGLKILLGEDANCGVIEKGEK